LQLLTVIIAVSATDDAFNIELKQKDAEVYHEQSFGKNEFNYGYQVERTNSQFQHKVKGPDDVTYGCYGYIDPVGEKHLVYYIADRLGYRLLAPDQPTKVFTERVANSVNKLDADLLGRKLDEKVVAWNDLYLPSTCRRLDEIVSITPPPTTASPVLPPVNGGFIQGGNGGFIQSGSNGQGAVSTTERPVVSGSAGSSSVDQDTGNSNGESSSGDGVAPDLPVIEESTQTNLSTSGGISSSTASNNPSGNVGEGTSGDKKGVEDPKDLASGDLLRSTPAQPIPVTPTSTPPSVPNTTTSQEPSPAPKQIDPVDFPPRTTYLPVTTTSRSTIIRVPDQPSAPSSPPPQPNCRQDSTGPRPKHSGPSIAQFNGFVFPINRNCDDSGRNTADLLAQMQSLNEMVLKVSNTLHALVETDRNRAAVNETCERVLELLNIQQPVPLLVYVPIMVPYLDGGINSGGGSGGQQAPVNPASYEYAKTCSECR
uniref:Structural constituent of cuticle n=1 Tax=Anopheles epiroticus TaxID=199890 RepID=A0A182PUM6_9DIPT